MDHMKSYSRDPHKTDFLKTSGYTGERPDPTNPEHAHKYTALRHMSPRKKDPNFKTAQDMNSQLDSL